MSAKGGGNSSKGGSYKARGSTQNERVGYSKALQTPQEHIIKLRKALVNDNGTDKDVLAEVGPFCKYDRNDLNVTMEFVPGKKAKKELRQFMFKLTKANMEEEYTTSGYGWDDEDKKDELRDEAARFVVLRDKETRDPLGFMHWRFTLTGEPFQRMDGEPALLVYDLQLKPEVQRKGLGKHMMMLSEIVARKNDMPCVTIQACKGGRFLEFAASKLKDYAECEETPEDAIVILQKTFAAAAAAAAATPSTAASLAATFAKAKPAPLTPAKSAESEDDAASAKATPEATVATEAKDVERQNVEAAIASVEALKFDEEEGSEDEESDEEEDEESDGEASEEGEIDPADLDGQADALIMQLCDLFAQKNGRDPTEDEIQKWRDTFREAATQNGDNLYANDANTTPPADNPQECKQQ